MGQAGSGGDDFEFCYRNGRTHVNHTPATPEAKRRWRALFEAVAAGAALLLLVFFLREFERIPAAFPQVQGRLAVEGIEAPVEMRRDDRGVPHIRARSQADAYTALGFAHAQDRLAQMLWLRATARGRSSEWVGDSGIPADQEARLLNIGGVADAEAARLEPSTLAVLEAFSRGVNVYLQRIRLGEQNLPLALGGLDIESMENWTPSDSLALVKLYAWGLDGSLESSLVYQHLLQRLGGFGANPFLPESTNGASAGAWPARGEGLSHGSAPGEMPVASFGALRRAAGMWGRSVGSSAWVVGAGYSESGYPLLAADLHFEPTAPAAVMEAHFSADDLDVGGVMIPGVPVVWTGRNAEVSWAATGTSALVLDLFVEAMHTKDPNRYRDAEGWHDIVQREEVILVRGGKPVVMKVRETRRGPLLQPWFAQNDEPLSLAWTGRLKGNGVAAMLRAVTASDVESFRSELAGHHEPPLIFALADRHGGAAMQMAGWLPLRLFPTRHFPVPGRSNTFHWQGPVPFAQLPGVTLAEEAGWLIAADNALSSWDAGTPIEWRARNGIRARRIAERLRKETAHGLLTRESLTAIQRDTHSETGLALLKQARRFLSDPAESAQVPGSDRKQAQQLMTLLDQWDGNLAAESRGAAAYHLWVDACFRELFSVSLGPELLRRYLALPESDPEAVLLKVLQGAGRGSGEPWVQQERQKMALTLAMSKAWTRLVSRDLSHEPRVMDPSDQAEEISGDSQEQMWRWGELHALRFRPLFGEAEEISTISPLPSAGDGHSVGAAAFDGARPFDVRVASVYYFAVDTGQIEVASASLLPGQSEHPGHPHFSDGLDSWKEGKLGTFYLGKNQEKTPGERNLRLLPISSK